MKTLRFCVVTLFISVVSILFSIALAPFLPIGCGGEAAEEEPPAEEPPAEEPPANPTAASDWVSEADWDSATSVTLTMVENADDTLAFSPNTLTFTAGQPYILKIVNPTGNTLKHYFSTEGAAAFVEGQNFYQAIATRKIETADAEYKAPYFQAVEMLVPTDSDRELEIYFVAVIPGTYAFYCEIAGHEALGMFGTITIEVPTGSDASDFALDLEVATDFNAALADDARKSGSDPVWVTGTRVDMTSTLTENADFTALSFDPSAQNLTKDVGYKLTLTNPAGNTSKHYFYDEADASGNFFRTVVFRKAQDSHAEIKPYYLKAVELRTPSGSNLSTDLYFVPTVAGAYENVCTVAGHKALGMTGTITVAE